MPPWSSCSRCWPSRSVATCCGYGRIARPRPKFQRWRLVNRGALVLRDDARVVQALHRARPRAYGPGEFVGQESLMRASEILSLARRAGVGPEASVLDLCCGVAGPGRMITRALGCTYVGLDRSFAAVTIAR